MTDPLVDPADLALMLDIDVDSFNVDRAAMFIRDAQNLCEAILSPLPATADGIVRRVAARAYTNITSAHTAGIGTANVSFGAPNSSIGIGGMYLSKTDEKDLRRLAGGGGAFEIDLLPTDYVMDVQPWDFNGVVDTTSTS